MKKVNTGQLLEIIKTIQETTADIKLREIEMSKHGKSDSQCFTIQDSEKETCISLAPSKTSP